MTSTEITKCTNIYNREESYDDSDGEDSINNVDYKITYETEICKCLKCGKEYTRLGFEFGYYREHFYKCNVSQQIEYHQKEPKRFNIVVLDEPNKEQMIKLEIDDDNITCAQSHMKYLMNQF
jgi:hypothetical protein